MQNSTFNTFNQGDHHPYPEDIDEGVIMFLRHTTEDENVGQVSNLSYDGYFLGSRERTCCGLRTARLFSPRLATRSTRGMCSGWWRSSRGWRGSRGR